MSRVNFICFLLWLGAFLLIWWLSRWSRYMEAGQWSGFCDCWRKNLLLCSHWLQLLSKELQFDSKLEWNVKVTGCGMILGNFCERLRLGPGGSWTLVNSPRALRLWQLPCDSCLKSETSILHNWFFSCYQTSCSCAKLLLSPPPPPWNLCVFLARNVRDWETWWSRKGGARILAVLLSTIQMLLITVLVLKDSVTLLRPRSHSCDATSIINPCFQVLMTALRENHSLGWNFSYPFSPPRWNFLFWSLAESSVPVTVWGLSEGPWAWGLEILQKWHLGNSGPSSVWYLGVGAPRSLCGPCLPVIRWFCKSRDFSDSWVLKRIP